LGCARCHDHKYDPLRNKEFYQFFAFFNTVPEKGLDGRTGNAEPVLQMPSPEQKTRLDELKIKVAAKEAELPEEEVAAAEKQWMQGKGAELAVPAQKGLLAHYEFDEHLADTSGGHQHGRLISGNIGYNAGMVGKGADFADDTNVIFGERGPENESFSLTL